MEIEFEGGVPKKISWDSDSKEVGKGSETSPLAIIGSLNKIAGMNGVGRVDHVEDRVVGLKTREVYECPAAIVLIAAHKDLEKLVLTKRELDFKREVDAQWAEMAYNGLWMDPFKSDLDAFIEKTSQRVNGAVRLKLFKGACTVVGRRSPNALYDENLATYGVNSSFDQTNSKGFIELYGLQTRMASAIQKAEKT